MRVVVARGDGGDDGNKPYFYRLFYSYRDFDFVYV